MSETCRYEELAHTADVGMRVYGATPEALFACTAHSLFALMGGAPGNPTEWRRLELVADDTESLLVAWLNELLYLNERSGEVLADVRVVAWTPSSIIADILCAPPRTPPQTMIKAVTYHRLRIVEQPTGWLADYYVDV